MTLKLVLEDANVNQWSIQWSFDEGPFEKERSVLPIEEVADRLKEVRAAGGGTVDMWVKYNRPDDDATLLPLGFEPYRDLWQLRVPLPTDPSHLVTSSFNIERDADDFLNVNNRAFHWHPEQGGWTVSDLREKLTEPWYSPTGFLMHRVQGRLAGFCWTKIHPPGPRPADHPALGEIYAIAVDPDFARRGLGKSLTLSGLEHLAGQGLEWGMLYVESDNDAANATYRSIGFDHHHTNRAYRVELNP